MSQVGTTVNSVGAIATAPGRGIVSDYMALTKARLSALVVLTAAVGYVLAAPIIDWAILLWTIIGTGLAAGCASVLNQLIEMRRDGLMHRTRSRPIPAGRMSAAHGLVAGALMGYAGLMILSLLVGLVPALLALITIALYAGAYTLLKTRTTLNTMVGAVCGAIPPMIGWTSGSGRLDAGAWILAAILFLWQLPHFLALAWLHRDDYARGGFVMLPAIDRSGGLSARVSLLSSLALVPVCMMLTLNGLTGWTYAAGAAVLCLALAFAAMRLLQRRDDASARRLFLASVIILPLLLGLMVIDRGPIG
jgi:protoheme IX farnesyltransferase